MSRNSKVLEIAKYLRQNSTMAEKILWQELRNRKLGEKFRRQMPLIIGSYHFVADFYCPKKKMIVELDGSSHNSKLAREYDQLREDILSIHGFKVIRFYNQEIIFNLTGVLDKIKKFLFS